MHPLLLSGLAGCLGSLPEHADDQLRSLAVNIDGWNVLHDEAPSRENGTDFGPVPVHGFYGFVDARLVGEVQDWTVELEGEPFSLVTNDWGMLDGILCAPPDVGVFEGLLTVTADSQPGRSYRVPLRCEGTEELAVVPVFGSDIEAGQVLGHDISAGTTVRFDLASWSSETLFDGAFTPVPPGLREGVFSGADGVGLFSWDGDRQRYVSPPTPGVSWASADGTVMLHSDGATLVREVLGEAPVERFSGSYLAILWADEDARWAVVSSGNQGWTLRDLFLIDTETGHSEPFVAPDGAPWSTGYGAQGVVLLPDRSAFLLPYSSYGDASFAWVDVQTGARTELLEPALAHLRTVSIGGDGPHISGWDVTPDFRYAAVVFDNIASDPGGFRMVFSGVYVIDLENGTTWLASVHPGGEPLDFVGGGYDGQLIEQVRIAPDGQSVLFAQRYVSQRSIWLEVP